MSELIHARVVERLQQMRLGHIAERLDALLAAAARAEPTYLVGDVNYKLPPTTTTSPLELPTSSAS